MSAPTGNPASNSFISYCEDVTGQKYLWTAQANRPGALEAARKHYSWWIAYMRKGNRRDFLGRPLYGPCYPCRFVVEYYDDKS